MITVTLIALTATGFAIYAISQRTKVGTRMWQFDMKNTSTGETFKFHIRSNDYSAALRAAFEARNLHQKEASDYISFEEIHELDPITGNPIHRVWVKAEVLVENNVTVNQ